MKKKEKNGGSRRRSKAKKRGNQKKKELRVRVVTPGPRAHGGRVAVSPCGTCRGGPCVSPNVPKCPHVSPRVPPMGRGWGDPPALLPAFFFFPATPVARVAPEHPAGIAAPPAPGGSWGARRAHGGAGGEMAGGNETPLIN